MVLLMSLAILCAVWGVVASVLIVVDLKRRGVSVSFLWMRLLILKYLHEYSKITREETGRVGPLFYHYVVPLNVALVLAVAIGILSR
jgi:hypothetical protein